MTPVCSVLEQRFSASSSIKAQGFIRASQMVLVVRNLPANVGDVKEVGVIRKIP